MEGSAVWAFPRHSLQLLVETCEVQALEEKQLVRLLLPLACSITLGLSTLMLYTFRKKGFLIVFEA